MISSLTGRLVKKGRNFVVLQVGGLGFKVFIPSRTKLPESGAKIKLLTYLYIREETMELYGFLKEKELNFFEILVAVSGIGPKLALSLLAVAPVEKLILAINEGDVELIKQTSGIGRKLAQRLIIELKDKVKGTPDKRSLSFLSLDKDIYEALLSLGYSSRQAKEAVLKINPRLVNLSERLKDALKKIR